MRPLRHRGRPATWPFVLLVLAWFCANGPQSLTYSVIVWAKGARHFSHLELLKAEVAFLLAGPHLKAVLAAARPAAPAIPVPEAAVMKKIELATSREIPGWIPRWEPAGFAWADCVADPSDRPEPALAPPRARFQA
jgi:hypothetical protein